jgi:hypothetical protein
VVAVSLKNPAAGAAMSRTNAANAIQPWSLMVLKYLFDVNILSHIRAAATPNR